MIKRRSESPLSWVGLTIILHFISIVNTFLKKFLRNFKNILGISEAFYTFFGKLKPNRDKNDTCHRYYGEKHLRN